MSSGNGTKIQSNLMDVDEKDNEHFVSHDASNVVQPQNIEVHEKTLRMVACDLSRHQPLKLKTNILKQAMRRVSSNEP